MGSAGSSKAAFEFWRVLIASADLHPVHFHCFGSCYGCDCLCVIFV